MTTIITPVATLPMGTRGLDYVTPPVSETQLYADGWRFVCRYIAQSTSIGKLVTAAEIRRIHAAGLGLFLNYEWSAGRWRGGAAAGYIDGAFARSKAYEYGYPETVPILVSFDQDVTKADLPVLWAYADAFFKACAPFTIGAYGDSDCLNALAGISRLNWLAMATYWSQYTPLAVPVHIKQKGRAYGTSADINVTLLPVKCWLPHAEELTLPYYDDKGASTMRYYSEGKRVHDTRIDGGPMTVTEGPRQLVLGGPSVSRLTFTVTETTGPGFLSVAGTLAGASRRDCSPVSWDRVGETVTGGVDLYLPDGAVYVCLGGFGMAHFAIDLWGQEDAAAA